MKDEGWHAAGVPQDTEDALFDELGLDPAGHAHLHDDEGQEVAEGLELWEKTSKPDDAPRAP